MGSAHQQSIQDRSLSVLYRKASTISNAYSGSEYNRGANETKLNQRTLVRVRTACDDLCHMNLKMGKKNKVHPTRSDSV